MNKKLKWAISRHPEGVVLNPKEYVLNEEGTKTLLWDTAGEALNYYLEQGGAIEDINNGINIEQVEDDGEEV